MRAVCWHAPRDVRVETVPDPALLNPRDAIVRVTVAAICSSDLHLYNGVIPTMRAGDVLGHEFMGEVVEVGAGVGSLRRGDQVVVPLPIACGACLCCRQGLTSHRLPLSRPQEAYRMWNDKTDDCTKIVLDPAA